MTEVYPGRDDKVRAVSSWAGKSYMELAIQHLHSLELSDDTAVPTQEHKMNAEAEQFGIVQFHMSRISHLVNDDTKGFFNK